VATDVIDDGSVAPAPATADGAAPSRRPRLHVHRFLVVYVLLAAVLGATVAGIVLALGSSIHPGPAWSSWRPHGGGQGAAKEIAAYVAPTYRLPSGKQLVDVVAGAPTVSPTGKQSLPVHYVAVRGAKPAGDKVYGVSSKDSVMFSLCGLGPACSIATGTASLARGRLVRREILELALYTFKYVPSMKSVIAFIPPKKGDQPQYAVYLQKSELQDLLHHPLAQTLQPKTPLPNGIPSREIGTIDGLTTPRVYSYKLSQTQQGELVLVFQPLSA
jgi:hypothetical protein